MRQDGETRYRHEDSSPTFYGSQKAPSPERLIKSADGSKANRWWGKRLDVPGLNGLKYGVVKRGQGPAPRLQAGGREPSAKRKAFGTAFATATPPASYLASKNPRAFMGGFFAAWAGEERWKRGILYYLFSTENIGLVLSASGAPATSGLTKMTFSWKSQYGK